VRAQPAITEVDAVLRRVDAQVAPIDRPRPQRRADAAARCNLERRLAVDGGSRADPRLQRGERREFGTKVESERRIGTEGSRCRGCGGADVQRRIRLPGECGGEAGVRVEGVVVQRADDVERRDAEVTALRCL
jgi:hypothetical protein